MGFGHISKNPQCTHQIEKNYDDEIDASVSGT